ncbi:MAG: MerR family transcriptional regulator [Anaerolineae bacterium]|nr:MerR family transcriptional regulator [Anaerolineae bacterium]
MRLKVGEFSRLCQVPVKTLRYYDEIGLFTPSDTDRFTSYRYYTLDQLPRIHRIMALKELGLSLDQIAQLVNANLSPDQIHDMFMRQQAEVQQRVNEELARLALVKFHLRQLELDSHMPELQIVVKRLESFNALTLRKVFPTQAAIDDTGNAILRAILRGVLADVALPMGIAYADEFTRHDLDYEFVLPVQESSMQPTPLDSSGTLLPREVQRMEMAATYLYQGDYDGLNDALIAVQRWAVANGYRLGREMRMIYFRGPMHHVAPAQYLTEIQHQIEKV